MTDHAHELRRYARKIAHPAGDVPAVMLAAADEIERLTAMLEAAERERDALRVDKATLQQMLYSIKNRLEAAENDSAHHKALAESALRVAKGWEGKCDALRAKIEAMERQEPFDANSDVFRGAFEAALKAGNWPMTRQGDGYRSPSTQIAWRIAFSTVNRLKLYLAPGAQPEPSIPEGWKPVPIEVIYLYSIMCAAFVPMTPQQKEIALQLDLAKRAMLAAAPEAKP